ncbi:MAG: O-methyltransferase [Bryobacteraceae bacterium]
MNILQQLRSSTGRLYHAVNARRTLSGLTGTNPQLATAMIDAISGKTSEAEEAWIGRIEDLRRRLTASCEELEITDYGAGSGDSHLTEEQMYRGRVIQRTIGEICTLTSRTERTALLLFRLVRELKPRTCIELGTSLGISACYQAAALKLNGAGKLVTLEGANSVASVATRNFAELALDNIEIVRGPFQDTLDGVLSSHPAVDYAFIDGHHDEAATIRYFNLFLPALTSNAVVVLDDIRWSDGMKSAWAAIRWHERVRVSVDLGSMGLIAMAGGSSPRHFSVVF